MGSSPFNPFKLHQGDARHLRKLLDRLAEPNNPPLTCTITSPPYGAVKNYDHPDQIGWGQPYDEYLVEMRRIFQLVYQYTRLDGSMWLIADTLREDGQRNAGLPTRMEPLPFQLAEEAADAGWILRDSLIWDKQKTLPWSSAKRLRNVFEYVLLFVKSSEYKFYNDRLRDPENLEEWWVKWPERYNPVGKAPTNVWRIPIPQQGSWRGTAAQHDCPLPPDLVKRLILLSTDPGDVVFDPFAGTGVVVAESERLHRRGLGIELNKRYVQSYATIRREIRARGEHDPEQEGPERAMDLHGRIVRLRALKYAKVLWQKLSHEPVQLPQLIVVQTGKIVPDTMADASHPLHVKAIFVYEDSINEDLQAIQLKLKEFVNRAPATKFGIAGEILVVKMSDLPLYLKRGKLFLYERGQTWNSVRQVKARELADLRATSQVSRGQYAYPPIVGDVEVHETPGAKPW
jgi:DNA modification methylase